MPQLPGQGVLPQPHCLRNLPLPHTSGTNGVSDFLVLHRRTSFLLLTGNPCHAMIIAYNNSKVNNTC